MGMFDNYTADTQHPDNRHVFCWEDDTDEIVVGGTSEHIFKVNFDYTKACKAGEWFEVLYKQSISGYSKTYGPQIPGASWAVEDGKTVVNITITPDESKLYDPKRMTLCQIKFFMLDGSVIYSKIHAIRIVDTLDRGE